MLYNLRGGIFMTKDKFKIIPIIMVIILAFMVPFVSAENEVEGVVPISEEGTTTENVSEEGENTVTSEDDVTTEEPATTSNDDSFKQGDVYLTGDKVTIDYVVDGNLFVTAKEVVINSQIGGDAFICANSITVGEQGYIFSNLFAFSSNVSIQGVVYDLYAFAQNVTISGYVYRDIRVNSGSLDISGTIGRNAFVSCDNLSLGVAQDMQEGESTVITTQGSISGNLNYTSSSEAQLPEGAVQGETYFTKASSNKYQMNSLLLSLGTMVASSIIIWLLCLWLAPKFLKNTASLLGTKKVLPVIGLGIATPIVLVIAMFILFLLGITASIGLLATTLLVALMLIASSVFVITVNNLVCQKLKIEKTIGIFGMLIVCAIALWALELIPYLGTIIAFIAGILGLGIISYSLIFKGEKKLKDKVAKD